jgi:hypothetical protein
MIVALETENATSTLKDEIIDLIRRMPDNVTTDDIMEALYTRICIEKGLQQLDAGQCISHDEMKQRVASWQS